VVVAVCTVRLDVTLVALSFALTLTLTISLTVAVLVTLTRLFTIPNILRITITVVNRAARAVAVASITATVLIAVSTRRQLTGGTARWGARAATAR
jgi:hypothetical protein